MNITYTPASKTSSTKDRMSHYDAAISQSAVKNTNKIHKTHNDVENAYMYKNEEIELLVSRRFWSVFLSLFVISTVTAWIYAVNDGGSINFSSVFVGTILLTLPASFLHANYFKSKISR